MLVFKDFFTSLFSELLVALQFLLFFHQLCKQLLPIRLEPFLKFVENHLAHPMVLVIVLEIELTHEVLHLAALNVGIAESFVQVLLLGISQYLNLLGREIVKE